MSHILIISEGQQSKVGILKSAQYWSNWFAEVGSKTVDYQCA